MTDQRGIPSALLRRLVEEDDSLLDERGRDVDGLMIERLYQSSWPLRYVPYPILFGAFLIFGDYAEWWSILALTALYTFGTWYLDRQRQAVAALGGHIADPALWGRRFAYGSAVTGLTWGLLGAWYFPAGDVRLQAVMAVTWAGLAFSSMNSRAAHLPSYYAFLLTMSVPVYLRTFFSGELAAISMVLLGLVLGAAFSLGAHAANRHERLGFALRLRNAELLGDVDLARAAAESGRRDTEAANRAALDEFSAAQRLSGHGSWSWDAPQERMSWSDEFFRLIGLPPKSCPATLPAWLEQVHPDDRDAVRGHYQRLRNGARRDQMTFRLADPARAGRQLQAIGETECDAQGRPTRIYGILRDAPDHSTP